MAFKRSASLRCVMIVSRHSETREALRAYLDESGLEAHASDSADVERFVPRARAVVLFPDDFSERRAVAFADAIRRLHPGVLLIVVTREPQRLSSIFAESEHPVPPLVLPRSSFGWSILDAIRAHASAEAPG